MDTIISSEIIKIEYWFIAISILFTTSLYTAYIFGLKKGRNSDFFIESENSYEPLSYFFENGKSLDETILKIEDLLKENNTFKMYYYLLLIMLQRIIKDQKENSLKLLTPRYIYDNFLYPVISDNEKLKFNFCVYCLKKEKISLIEDLKLFRLGSEFNFNLFDTKECSCCKKTNDVLNPLIYTVMIELNLADYFEKMDNEVRCPKIWHD
ncbi:hypothetical protein [Aliarcobacter butzleri]|uniref:hypothetical protein n=1 Tax=Aliarcobacter butzleri TaxID=28197 RepID=UPI001269D32F|nr:hypothetical protein [Aliarcobacter butzleri]